MDLQASLAEQKRNGTGGRFGAKATSTPSASLVARDHDPVSPDIERLHRAAEQLKKAAWEARKLACQAQEAEVAARFREVFPDATAVTVVRDFERDVDGHVPYIDDEFALEHADGSYSVFDREALPRSVRDAVSIVQELSDDEASSMDYIDVEDHTGHPFSEYANRWGERPPMARLELSTPSVPDKTAELPADDGSMSAREPLETYAVTADKSARAKLAADAIRETAADLAPEAESIIFTRDTYFESNRLVEDEGSSLTVLGVMKDGLLYHISDEHPDVYIPSARSRFEELEEDLTTYLEDTADVAGLRRGYSDPRDGMYVLDLKG